MKTRQLVLLVGVSALAGSLLTLLLTRSSHQGRLPLAGTERAVDSQTLRFVDGAGRILAELFIDVDSGVTLSLSSPAGLLATANVRSDATWIATFYGGTPQQRGSIKASMDPFLSFGFEPPGGKYRVVRSRDTVGNVPTILAFLREGRRTLVPLRGDYAVAKVLAVEQLRLTDQRHHTVAAAGISPGGDPALALTDKHGCIGASWTLVDGQWSQISLYDRNGSPRVSVLYSPGARPNMEVWERDNLSPYHLDPNTGEELPGVRSEIPWLAPLNFTATLPLVLVDVSGKELWRFPQTSASDQRVSPLQLIPPEQVEVFELVMRPDTARPITSDRRPIWVVSGRIKNNADREVTAVKLRISVLSGDEKLDSAEFSPSGTTILPGGVRSFAESVRITPTPSKWRWICAVVEARGQ